MQLPEYIAPRDTVAPPPPPPPPSDPAVGKKPIKRTLHWQIAAVIGFSLILVLLLVDTKGDKDATKVAKPSTTTAQPVNVDQAKVDLARLLDTPKTPNPPASEADVVPDELKNLSARQKQLNAVSGGAVGSVNGRSNEKDTTVNDKERRDWEIRASKIMMDGVDIGGADRIGGIGSAVSSVKSGTTSTKLAELDAQLAAVRSIKPVTQADVADLALGKGGNSTASLTSLVGNSGEWNTGGNNLTPKTPLPSYAPVSKMLIHEGSIIPAVALSQINSDLPGSVTAMVVSDIYDTTTSNYLLIPKGTKLVGDYNSNIAVGQERVAIAFRRMILPNGVGVQLGNFGGADQIGQSGATGDVNNHFLKIFGSSLLIAVATANSSKFNSSSTTGSGETINYSSVASQVASQVAQQMMARYQRLAPTITIASGSRFSIMVARDIKLEPYQ